MIGSPEAQVTGGCGSRDTKLEGALSRQHIQPLHCAGGETEPLRGHRVTGQRRRG